MAGLSLIGEMDFEIRERRCTQAASSSLPLIGVCSSAYLSNNPTCEALLVHHMTTLKAYGSS